MVNHSISCSNPIDRKKGNQKYHHQVKVLYYLLCEVNYSVIDRSAFDRQISSRSFTADIVSRIPAPASVVVSSSSSSITEGN